MDVEPEVFSSVSGVQDVPMNAVLGDEGRPFPGYPQQLTLLGVELHKPLFLPLLEGIKVPYTKRQVIDNR